MVKNNASFWLSLPLAKDSAFLCKLSRLPFFFVLFCFLKFDVVISYPVFILILSSHYSQFSGFFGDKKINPCV